MLGSKLSAGCMSVLKVRVAAAASSLCSQVKPFCSQQSAVGKV